MVVSLFGIQRRALPYTCLRLIQDLLLRCGGMRSVNSSLLEVKIKPSKCGSSLNVGLMKLVINCSNRNSTTIQNLTPMAISKRESMETHFGVASTSKNKKAIQIAVMKKKRNTRSQRKLQIHLPRIHNPYNSKWRMTIQMMKISWVGTNEYSSIINQITIYY